jgi:hypothetical protein
VAVLEVEELDDTDKEELDDERLERFIIWCSIFSMRRLIFSLRRSICCSIFSVCRIVIWVRRQ